MGLRKKLAPSLPFRARKAFGGEGFISKFMYIGYMTRLVVSKRFWGATYFEPTEFIGSAPVGYGFGRYLEPEAAGWVTYPVIQYVEESDIVDTIIPAKVSQVQSRVGREQDRSARQQIRSKRDQSDRIQIRPKRDQSDRFQPRPNRTQLRAKN